MFLTPRRPAVKRRLFTTPVSAKRFRSGNRTNAFRSANRRSVPGPSRSGTLAQQVKSLQRVVKDILPELKNVTVDLVQTNMTNAGTVQHISGVAQGVTETTRVGEDIVVRSIIVKGSLSNYTTTNSTVAPVYFRFAVIVDKQQIQDSAATIATIFSGTADPVIALPTTEFSERYRYLWISPLISSNAVINGGQLAVCDFTWNGVIKVGYNGPAVSDIQKNGLYFCILSSDAAGTVDFAGSARITYTDS